MEEQLFLTLIRVHQFLLKEMLEQQIPVVAVVVVNQAQQVALLLDQEIPVVLV